MSLPFSSECIAIPESAADPSSEADKTKIYAKDSGGTTKLFVRDSSGAVGNLASTGSEQTFSKAQTVAPSALTYGANIPVNALLSNVFTVTLTGATAQLDNPTNLVDGQTLIFRIRQDAVGGRALTFGTNYDFGSDGTPNLTTSTANKMDIITAISDGTKVFCAVLRGFTP